ncbi:MAG: hypothetical protein WCH85_07360 [Methanomicrobiales archaeon]
MNAEQEADNEMTVLLKYYTWKVFSKIKSSRKLKEKTSPTRKNRAGED